MLPFRIKTSNPRIRESLQKNHSRGLDLYFYLLFYVPPSIFLFFFFFFATRSYDAQPTLKILGHLFRSFTTTNVCICIFDIPFFAFVPFFYISYFHPLPLTLAFRRNTEKADRLEDMETAQLRAPVDARLSIRANAITPFSIHFSSFFF